jgi:hypothetical protein
MLELCRLHDAHIKFSDKAGYEDYQDFNQNPLIHNLCMNLSIQSTQIFFIWE